MATVTVSRADDRLIAVKWVASDHAEELQREAELLRQLDHPGVVNFIDLQETPDGGRSLHTLFVSSDTWATRPLCDPAERAAKAAALAAIIADLHELGITHRYINAAHVLHGDGDRPVLCSLSRAGNASQENRHLDLAALAELIYDDKIKRSSITNKLSALADEVRSGQLSAQDVAHKLNYLLSQKKLQGRSTSRNGLLMRNGPTAPSKASKWCGIWHGMWRGMLSRTSKLVSTWPTTKTVTLAGLTLIGIGIAGFVFNSIHNNHTVEPGPDATNTASDDAAVRTAAAGRNNADTGHDKSSSNTAADHSKLNESAGNASTSNTVIAQGEQDQAQTQDELSTENSHLTEKNSTSNPNPSPPAESTLEQLEGHMPSTGIGTLIEHKGRRYAIGVADDIVLTGDWNCDGEVTPSIVRPSVGAVALFYMWPDPGETISNATHWQIDGLTDVQVEKTSNCDMLRVHTTTGSYLLDPKGTR